MNSEFNSCLKKSPPGVQLYSFVLVLFFSLFIIILIQGRYGKQEIVRGLVRDESYYRIAASKVGNVTELYVKEGEIVDQGAPLFRVALPWQDVKDQLNGKSMLQETILRLTEAQRDIKTEQDLYQREWDNLVRQKEKYFLQLNNKLEKISQVEADYEQKTKLYKKQMAELVSLLKTKSINKSEVENLKQIIIDNNLALAKAKIERETLLQSQAEQEINYLRMERELLQNKNNLEARLRDIVNELNKIQMEQEYIVTSPVAGKVHDVGILEGDFVDGKVPSMIIKKGESSKPVVILYLSGNQIGLIDKNEKVFLRVDTFPYESYGMVSARVTNIASTPTLVSMDEKESLFRVKLKITEEDKFSKIPLAWLNDGMPVTTSLRQPKQNLFEWLFLPMKKALKRNPDFIE
ncbi:HlyD family secretion protein [Kalamiella sp. sgz302252]|uniref:HlyD family secretion protein n=1 Tax=Pantoea sp. sgz302252 TaxID=3341827 RepID=UPI0036D2F22E